MRRVLLTVVTTLAFAVLPVAVASGAEAPSTRSGAPGIGDPYFPVDGNGGYDVRHYGISVAYDPATDRLLGRVHIRARSLQPLSRFNLDLVGLSVDAVVVNGARARWSRTAHELTVTPRHALPKGRTFHVFVRYHGVPRLLDEPALASPGCSPPTTAPS